MTGEAEKRREVLPDPAKPSIQNGSFEEAAGDPEEPSGWHYQRQLELVNDPKAPSGKRYAKFVNERPGRHAQALQGFAADGRQVKSLRVTLRVRAEDIRPTGSDGQGFPDIRLPQSRPETTNFPVPKQPRGPDIQHPRSASEDDLRQFVGVVLAETEDVWRNLFNQYGARYSDPKLVLFSGGVRSACGIGMAQMGPFYCPSDRRIYLDTSFFRAIETRFRGCQGKACKFAQAYVITHEVGHHVQNLLGILPKARAEQRAAGSKVAANRIQVRVELQADCFAGVWANRSEQRRQFLDPGDIDAALQTATAIGDDTLQKRAQGRIVPDAFTHGSAEQRKRWFMTGFTQGKLAACNTFTAAQL